jgi:hypothetical protein
MVLLFEEIIVETCKEVETGCNVAESSEEGSGVRRLCNIPLKNKAWVDPTVCPDAVLDEDTLLLMLSPCRGTPVSSPP